jgi:hypothetical protein
MDILTGDRLWFLGNGEIEIVRGGRSHGFTWGAQSLQKDAGGELPDGARWITLHPNGKDDPDNYVRVVIRPNPDGSASVIGGAGGKLNQLHLSRLKSPEEWKENAKANREKRKEKENQLTDEQKRDREMARREGAIAKTENAKQTLNTLREHGIESGITDEQLRELDTPPQTDADESEWKAWKANAKQVSDRAKAIQNAYEHKLVTDNEALASAFLGEENTLGDVGAKVIVDRAHVAASPDGDVVSSVNRLPSGDWLVRNGGDGEDKVYDRWEDAAKEHVANVVLNEQERGGDRTQAEDFYDPSQWITSPEEELPEGFTFKAEAAAAIAALAAERKAGEKNTKYAEKAIERGKPYAPGYDVDATDEDVLASIQDKAKLYDDAFTHNKLLDMVDDRTAKDLQAHVSNGGYSSLADLASDILKVNTVNRAVVEAVGHNEAAKLLAYQARQNLTPAEYERATQAQAALHARESTRIANEAIAATQPMMERLSSANDEMLAIEEGALKEQRQITPDEQLAIDNLSHEAHELKAAIDKRLGTTVGSLQASAALVAALEGKPDSLRFVGSGNLKSTADLVPQMWGDRGEDTPQQTLFDRYGLTPDDFEIIPGDGGEQSIKINPSGVEKLAKAEGVQEDREAYEKAQAIKRGELDEPDFTPSGFKYRPKSTYTDAPKEANQFGVSFDPPQGTGDDSVREELLQYVGARVANGSNPMDVFGELHSQEFAESLNDAEQVGRVIQALDRQFFRESEEKGGYIDEKSVISAFREYAEFEATRQREKGLASGEAIHKQKITDKDAAIEASHRALSAMPMARVAFKPTKTRRERRWMREYAITEIMGETIREDAIASKQEKEQEKAEEPGLFGAMDFSATVRLTEQEKAMGLTESDVASQMASASAESNREASGGQSQSAPKTQWDEFVDMLGGERQAYEAVEDRVRGQFLHRFSQAYNRMASSPIALASQQQSGAKGVAMAMLSPDDRDRHSKEMAELRQRRIVSLRSRDAQGRLQSEEDDWLNVAERFKQTAGNRQFSLFNMADIGGTQRDNPDRQKELLNEKPKMGHSDRISLGESAEQQLMSEILPSVLGNFEQVNDPVSLYPEVTWNGPHASKQRVLKMVEEQKKVGVHFGAGSGKSSIMLGVFTELKAKGKAKRTIIAAPSGVVGQFAGECCTFLEPGKYNFNANLGYDRAKRMESYRDPNLDIHVTTRESLTNDLLYMIQEHAGVDGETFKAASEGDRRQMLLSALQKEGIDPADMVFSVDEAHDVSHRRGVEASNRSLVLETLAHLSGHYLSATGTPTKNDLSEMYSFLHSVAPEKFNDEKGFLATYGSDTIGAKRALQRAVAPYSYAASTKPRSKETGELLKMNEKSSNIKPHEYQTQERDRITQNYDKISQWYAKETPRVIDRIMKEEGAMRPLSGEDFAHAWEDEGLKAAVDAIASPETWGKMSDEQKKAAIGGQVMASGAIKNVALNRLYHLAPYDKNPKAQETVKMCMDYVREQGKQGVVFSASSEGAAMLAEQLRGQGVNVGVIDGSLSAQQKSEERLKFTAKGAERGEYDILIATDAAQTGLNLASGRFLIHYDVPMTKKAYDQRSARIHRLGQIADTDIHTMMLDTPEEKVAMARMSRKGEMGEVLQSRSEVMDDTGLAGEIERMRLGERRSS